MELEEAIKTIKNIIYDNKGNPMDYIDISFSQSKDDIGAEEFIQAIETVLQALKKLQDDNYKLDKENQKLFEININSIPKKKIEHKVKELNKGIKEDMKNHDKVKDINCKFAIYRSMKSKIEVKEFLQELLEDK